MTETSTSNLKHCGTKPRLSLLSSKQSGAIRLDSDDRHDIHESPQTLDSGIARANVNTIMDSFMNTKQGSASRASSQDLSSRVNGTNNQNSTTSANTTDENKMNISKEDLIRLLSMLKSELQSKEVALAAIKCEQLKRLINPVEISRSSLAITYMQLQNRLERKDTNNNGANTDSERLNKLNTNAGDRNEADGRNEERDLENLNILNTLLELLDRHPLLALPRDSIYCLDYNCGETSTKNYLNLKIQHLDNLINQHRRYRYYMSERLKRCEQRLFDVSRELEVERISKRNSENQEYKNEGRATLLKHISQLKDTLEEEKKGKHAIVVTLLNELLDAKEQKEALNKELDRYRIGKDTCAESKGGTSNSISITVSSKATATDEISNSSIKDSDLRAKIAQLEEENKVLKAKLEQQEWKLSAVMKPEKIPPDIKDSASSNTSSQTVMKSPGTLTGGVKAQPMTNGARKGLLNSSQSISSSNQTKATLTSLRSQPSLSSASNYPTSRAQPSSVSPSVTTSRNSTAKYTNSTNTMVKANSLPKTTNATDPDKSPNNQQLKSPKMSLTSFVGGSAAGRLFTPPLAIAKPEVPAKPAQLLDKQAGSK